MTADALPRPHCRRCDTALVNDLQLGHGLCDLHITQYQEMRAAFYTNGAEAATNLQRLPELNIEPIGGAALFYARAGIPVHPLRPGTKLPATKNGVKDASTDTRTVRDFWRDHPDHNIGLATGHKFDVLDVDTKDGRGGADSLARLRLAGLTIGAWAAALTPTGGQHVLYTPSGDGNHVDRASGLDFRGAGGYIVAAPSVTKDGAYQWKFADPNASGLPFNWSAAMEHIHGPAPRPEHKIASTGDDIGGLAGFLSLAQPGERNHSLYWAACRAAESGLPTDELLAAAIQIGLPEREAARTIQSAENSIGVPA